MTIRRSIGTQAKLWAIATIAVATLCIGGVLQVLKDRASTIEAAEQTTRQLAQTLATSAAGLVRTAELVADHVGTITLSQLDEAGNPTRDALASWSEILKQRPFMHAIAFVRTDGVIPYTVVRWDDGSTRVFNRNLDITEWPAFKLHLNGEAGGLHIGFPRPSSFIDRWLVPFTRPIRNAEGKLLGIVYVDIELDTFLNLFSGVLPEGNNSGVLFHTDGRLLLAYPFSEEVIGRSFADLSLFTEHLPSASTGTYQAQARTSRDFRFLSYRIVENQPLMLTVDVSISEVLGPWRQRAQIYGTATVGAVAVILSLTFWLSIQFRVDEKTRKTLMLREKSLEESQRLAGIGHFEHDIRTNVITWAGNMYRIHGVSPEIYKPDRDSFMGLVVSDGVSRVQEQIHLKEVPPERGRLESRIMRPDGETRDMIYDWQVIRDQDGSPIRLFGVAQDITDLKASENAVRENEARLRDITECISDFIWEGDENGVVTHFDSGSNDVRVSVVLGKTKDERVDHDTGGGDWADVVQAMAHHQPYRNLNIPFHNDEGETRWIRISGNPRFTQDGKFIGYRGAGSDITEQRQQRISLIERDKSDALIRLAGGMAHEINNLLQPVVVYSSMGETEKGKPNQNRDYFQKIYTATQQALNIVKDVLTFTREDQTLPVPVPLAATLKESADLIRPSLPETVTIDGPNFTGDINVGAHSSGLQRVLVNLLRNAVDATGPNGHILIDVGTIVLYPSDAERRVILPGRYGFFSVTDDGSGIANVDLDKMFDPFYTTKPMGHGTGLGLSVVAGLVREWGGAVDVESRPGRTVFTVYLPLLEAAQQAAE